MTKELDIKQNLPKATEIVFSFDTTGSMSPCIANVRKHIEKTCEQLFQDIPDLKIGFISHGDYCDYQVYTLLKITDKREDIFNFIKTAPATGGGDAPECYELALSLAKGMGWSEAKGGKILVLIGDAAPHEPDYPGNKDHLDWRKELVDLKEMGVDVYPLQCLYNQRNILENAFWSTIAESSGTILMKLDDFEEASLTIGAIASAGSGTAGFDTYEKKLAGFHMSPSTVKNIEALRSVTPKYDTISTEDKKDE